MSLESVRTHRRCRALERRKARVGESADGSTWSQIMACAHWPCPEVDRYSERAIKVRRTASHLVKGRPASVSRVPHDRVWLPDLRDPKCAEDDLVVRRGACERCMPILVRPCAGVHTRRQERVESERATVCERDGGRGCRKRVRRKGGKGEQYMHRGLASPRVHRHIRSMLACANQRVRHPGTASFISFIDHGCLLSRSVSCFWLQERGCSRGRAGAGASACYEPNSSKRSTNARLLFLSRRFCLPNS